MDKESSIRKVLEEGNATEPIELRVQEEYVDIENHPRYNREWFNLWLHTFLDEPLPQDLDKGEGVSEKVRLEVAIARAFSQMKIHYRFMEILDVFLENGEGQIPANRLIDDGFLEETARVVGDLNFRWLRIVGNEGGRELVLATIYLCEAIGRDVQRMLLARVRKGLPPNPYDALPIAYRQENGNPARDKTRFVLPDPQGSQGVKGVRATQRVHIEPRDDNDHMWHFPGFRVRSSKLLPVLQAFRNHDIQRVDLAMLQGAIQRTAR